MCLIPFNSLQDVLFGFLSLSIAFWFFSVDAFDTEQLLDCIEKLKAGQSYQVPIYDFKTHRRCSDSFRQVNIFLNKKFSM